MPSLKLLVLVVEPENRREANPRYRFKTQNQKDAESLSPDKPLIIILDDEKITIEVPMREIKRWGRIYCEEINQWITKNNLHTYQKGNPPKLVFKQIENKLQLLFTYIENNLVNTKNDKKINKDCEGFFVYENWTHEYLRIHKGTCGHCKCGQGVQENILGVANGKWISESFNSYQIAKNNADAIANNKKFNVLNCKRCNPQT